MDPCCNPDPCDPNCPDYDPCLCDPCITASCPNYDPCICDPTGGTDPCNPDCPSYDPCACDPCSDVTCPDYDPCVCNPDPCDPNCSTYDPCNPQCPNYDPCYCTTGGTDPCNPDCPSYDPCACDPCSDVTCPDYDPCVCNPDPCDPNCSTYDPCNPQCPDYDPCYCTTGGTDPCNPDCPGYDPCLCDPCSDLTCPDYDPCVCAPDPCDPGCITYDPCLCDPNPCDPNCPSTFDPCLCTPNPCDPNCIGYDPCICDPSLCDCPVIGDIYVDINATGANNGSDWANAFNDLQDALAIGTERVIHIAKGTYIPGTLRTHSFSLPQGVVLLGGYPTGGGNRDPEAYVTILSGEVDGVPGLDENAYHVAKAINVSCVIIDGVTIKHGNANVNTSFAWARGGGLYSINSEVQLINVKTRWNKAIFGGGLFASQGSTINIYESDYKNNTADRGSAIYHSNMTQVIIRKTRILDNTSLVRCALEINNSLYTRIENSVIANNFSRNANAIGLIATNRNQSIEVYNTTILGEEKDRYLVTIQVGYGDQLDAYFYNSIIAHQHLNFTKAFVVYSNNIFNLHTENCYIQGSTVPGTSINNLFSVTAGDLMLLPDYSVSPCSPVVNAGNNAYAALPVDIDDTDRILNNLVDMGAYETHEICRMANNQKSQFLADMRIYPNPTTGRIEVQTAEEDITIHIYDVLGNRVLSTQERYLDLSGYASGVYIMNIEKEGEMLHVEKIIKK